MENATLLAIYNAATGGHAKKLKSQKAAFARLAEMPKRPTVRAALEAGVSVGVDDVVKIFGVSRVYTRDIFCKIERYE